MYCSIRFIGVGCHEVSYSPQGASVTSSASAVIDGKLRHFSVSQIKEFRRCPRRWAADKLLGYDRKGSDATTKGKSLHKLIERYYLGGDIPEIPAFEAAITEGDVPAPRPGLLVERPLGELTELKVGDVRLHGFSDLIIPPSPDGESCPEVWDWKNVSTFNYCVDPGEDLQMLVYGLAVLERWAEWSEVAVNLLYLSTRSRSYRHNRVVVTRERCEHEWNSVVVPTVKAMVELVELRPTKFKDAPPNYSNDYAACKAYGGCQFRSQCISLSARLDQFEPAEAA